MLKPGRILKGPNKATYTLGVRGRPPAWARLMIAEAGGVAGRRERPKTRRTLTAKEYTTALVKITREITAKPCMKARKAKAPASTPTCFIAPPLPGKA
jgi:hypothetical protein